MERELFQIAFYSISKIFTQMPSIGTLNRLWSSLRGSIGIDSTSVPAYHFDFWMRLKPFFDAFCFPIRKDIDDVMGISINKNRSIS